MPLNLCLGHDRYWSRQVLPIPYETWTHFIQNYPEAYVVVAARDRRSGDWIEEAFLVRDCIRKLPWFLDRHHRRDHDLFWSPNAYSVPRRDKGHTLPTPYVTCDVNEGDWRDFNPLPNIVLRTSPGHFHVLWTMHRAQTPGTVEALSKALAYRFLGTQSGRLCTALIRMPHTFNHNYDSRPEVTVEWFDEMCRRPKLGPKRR